MSRHHSRYWATTMDKTPVLGEGRPAWIKGPLHWETLHPIHSQKESTGLPMGAASLRVLAVPAWHSKGKTQPLGLFLKHLMTVHHRKPQGGKPRTNSESPNVPPMNGTGYLWTWV